MEIVDWDTLLAESDMISIHCPLTQDTENMFDDSAFKKMKSSAILVNTARGGIVNEENLLKAFPSNDLLLPTTFHPLTVHLVLSS